MLWASCQATGGPNAYSNPAEVNPLNDGSPTPPQNKGMFEGSRVKKIKRQSTPTLNPMYNTSCLGKFGYLYKVIILDFLE
jgi:hypothetical protein